MTLCKKPLRISVWLSSIVFGLVLLLGANPVRAQICTVLVSPVPGNLANAAVTGTSRVDVMLSAEITDSAASAGVHLSGYRAEENRPEIISLAFPEGCRTFCMVGRNQCNSACAEAGTFVAAYYCWKTEDGFCDNECWCR